LDIKESDILGDAIDHHWYYASKAKALTRLLQNSPVAVVMDVGAGSGFFSRYLLEHAGAEEAYCIDPAYPSDSHASLHGKTMHFLRHPAGQRADLILMMDVLEHVEDDGDFLRAYVARAEAGTRFLITVPAFQFLWSGHDVFLEHRRRYSLRQLIALADSSGLRVRNSCYYFGLIFPLAAMLRLGQRLLARGLVPRSQLTRHSATLNAILAGLCGLELRYMHRNRWAGLSIFCLAEKC